MRKGGVVAGFLDTGQASLATLAAGLFAARALSPTVLGGYAIAFSSFVFATMLPAQAIYTPAEVASVRLQSSERLALLPATLRAGLPLALLAGVGSCLWVAFAPRGLEGHVLLALSLSAAIAAVVSPMQDHVRRLLHLSARSSLAAVTSGIHLAVVVACLFIGIGSGHQAWFPFGALAAGNVVSIAAAFVISRGERARQRDDSPRALDLELRQLLGSGRWLLLLGLLPTGAALVVAVVVGHLAGPRAMGQAEAARILTQPLFVFATGLSAFLGPLSMEAAHRGDLPAAQGVSRRFLWMVLAGGVPFMLLVGGAWSWSPLPRLVPTAYAAIGLIWLTAIGNLLQGIVFPLRSELLGAHRERSLAGTEVAANLVRVGLGGLAGVFGSAVAPAGLIALGCVRWWSYRLVLRRHYADPAGAGAVG